MKMTITAKKMQIPQNFTEYAEERLNSRLNKFFGDEAETKITMANHKNLIVIELTVTYNDMIYRAEQSGAGGDPASECGQQRRGKRRRRGGRHAICDHDPSFQRL